MNLTRAQLQNLHDVVLTMHQPLTANQLQHLRLHVDDLYLEPLSHLKEEKHNHEWVYAFHRQSPFELGHAYLLVIEGYDPIPVHMGAALSFANFDTTYTYEKDDLGYTFLPKQTTFKVWAPLASSVQLMLYDDKQKIKVIYPMQRGEAGVYHYVVQGSLDGQYYRYGITNHGLFQSVIDPYGKALSRNSEYSVVVDFSKLTIPMYDEQLPPLKAYQDAILYEAHVRDLTSDATIAFPNPRTFLGAATPGLRSSKGNPVGFDYLCSLGFTHLQLLPVTDYRSVNEFKIEQGYNWGYDPYHYFSLEGSFASKPDDPTSRIRDFLTLVSRFHQKGIRINIDVVYNHVYDYQHNPFEKVVPGYYFRKLPNGTMSNGSYCGNDLASEKPMVRHLIVSAATFVVKAYHLDGFRFDLMGILDRETLRQIEKNVRAISPSFMLYGEGWNMPTHLPQSEKGITENSHLMANFAFFNDTFRNTIKGGNSDHDAKNPGYATGNIHGGETLPYLLTGSSQPHLGQPKVSHSSQSINYVECHDNNTFYDKLMVCQPNEGDMFPLRRIIFANSLVMFADGIPFFHMAQEVGGTKLGDHNSFESGDRINQFQYQWIDDRKWMVQSFQDLIHLRKLFRTLSPQGWSNKQLSWSALDHGGWQVTYQLGKKTLILLWNPSLHQVLMPASLLKTTLIYDGDKKTNQPLTLTHIPPIRFLMLEQR